MITTAIFIISMLGMLILGFYFGTIFLRRGVRWAKGEPITFRRALGVLLLASFLSLIGNVCFLYFGPAELAPLIYSAIQITILVIAQCSVISYFCKLNSVRSLQALIAFQVPNTAVAYLMVIIFRGFVFEAFVVPTNSMAPTLISSHSEGICPECGAKCFGSYAERGQGHFLSPQPVICEKFHIHSDVKTDNDKSDADKFLVAKFLKPQRWDLMVFKWPDKADVNFVKRLVGLPGEEIVIRDGFVYANGEKLVPPESLGAIKYYSENRPGMQQQLWGVDKPAKLGPDEYFTLGDFTVTSADSRYWEVGALGHPAYAVPENYIVGVVVNIYWPPSRWRIFK